MDKKKVYNLVAIVFLITGTSFWLMPSANAAQANANVVCGKSDGTQQSFQIGWNNSVEFFADKGYIPRLFCEGGYAQGFNTYVSDDLSDSSLGSACRIL